MKSSFHDVIVGSLEVRSETKTVSVRQWVNSVLLGDSVPQDRLSDGMYFIKVAVDTLNAPGIYTDMASVCSSGKSGLQVLSSSIASAAMDNLGRGYAIHAVTTFDWSCNLKIVGAVVFYILPEAS